MAIIGTLKSDISNKLRAIASPSPRSSAPIPQNAPAVFTKVITGRLNFYACFIKRNSLREPSGGGETKLRLKF
jgi:hypothetical protein